MILLNKKLYQSDTSSFLSYEGIKEKILCGGQITFNDKLVLIKYYFESKKEDKFFLFCLENLFLPLSKNVSFWERSLIAKEIINILEGREIEKSSSTGGWEYGDRQKLQIYMEENGITTNREKLLRILDIMYANIFFELGEKNITLLN